jgi:hypothetical protein
MSPELLYVVRSPLFGFDRASHAVVYLEAGSLLTYMYADLPKMAAVRSSGREILTFAGDLESRTEALRRDGRNQSGDFVNPAIAAK